MNSFFFNSCTCGVVERFPSLLLCLIFFVAIKTIFSFHPQWHILEKTSGCGGGRGTVLVYDLSLFGFF